MGISWWTDGQRYVAPDKSFTLARISATLYIRFASEKSFREVLVTKDDSNYGPDLSSGRFTFLDIPTGRTGRLVCSATTAFVTLEGYDTMLCNATTPAGNLSNPLTLRDIDLRQVPVALYGVEGKRQLVYFCNWVHAKTDLFDRVYLIDQVKGTLTDLQGRNITPSLPQHDTVVETAGAGTITVPPFGKPGNGSWGATTLIPLRLDDYTIVHDQFTGELMGITPKGR